MLREPWTIIMMYVRVELVNSAKIMFYFWNRFIVGVIGILVVTGTVYEAKEKFWQKRFLSNVIAAQGKYIQKFGEYLLSFLLIFQGSIIIISIFIIIKCDHLKMVYEFVTTLCSQYLQVDKCGVYIYLLRGLTLDQTYYRNMICKLDYRYMNNKPSIPVYLFNALLCIIPFLKFLVIWLNLRAIYLTIHSSFISSMSFQLPLVLFSDNILLLPSTHLFQSVHVFLSLTRGIFPMDL